MKIKDYLTQVIINFKGCRIKTVTIVIFFSILFLISNILIQTSTNISRVFNDYLKYYSEGRMLLVYKKGEYKDIVAELIEYEHIVLAYNYEFNYASSLLNLNDNTKKLEIYIKPLNDKYSPKIISGRKVETSGEIICPKYIEKKSSEIKTISDLVKMQPYLNNNIQLNYSKMLYKNLYTVDVVKVYNKEVKLVGLYDDGYSGGMFNECYMLEEDVKEFVQDSFPIYSDEYLEEVVVEENALSTFIVVDKIDNLDLVSRELLSKGYTVDKKFVLHTDLLENIIDVSRLLFLIMLIFLIFVFKIYLKNLIKSKKNEIGLYKCFGYSNKEISLIIILEILFIFILALILSRIFLEVGVVISNYQIDKILDYAYIDLKVDFIPQIIFVVLLTIFVTFISIITIKKVHKLEVGVILNENNL